MAEKKTIEKVEEQLNCSVCLDTYTDPKLLHCFHAYCRQCLVRLVVRDQQGQLTLTCPICRQATPVPANGVAGLQSAFHINNLLEIMEEHKKATDQPQSQESTPKSQAPQKKMLMCSEHENDKAELYCETCGELICLKCITKGGKHRDHDHDLVEQAFQRYKKEISPSFEPMDHQLEILKQALAQLDTCCEEILHQQTAVEADIHKNFDSLQETLHIRRTQLISQLHKIAQAKKKALAAQRDMLETLQAQLSSSLTFMRESFKTGNEGEVLMMKTTIVKRVEELTAPFQPDLLKPDTQADIIFSAEDDISTTCQNYGQLVTSNSPDPSECDILMKDPVMTVGEKSTAVLKAVNYLGQLCSEASSSFSCEVMSEITGTKTTGSIKRSGRGQYEISYQPTIKGRHQLHIKVEGQHIRGSPFSMVAKAPVEKLDTPILTIRGVETPYGVAITQSGEVVVTEVGTKHCVSVFSPSGDRLRSFGTPGSGQGQFNNPYEVAVDGEGNILVTDWDNHRIQKFTAEGQFLTAVGTQGTGPLQFSHPSGIAVNSTNNKVYVGDCYTHRIQVLNSDLTFSSTFGKQGSGKGQFEWPCGIACDSSGKVYVSDSYNHRIQVFTAEGKFLRKCGEGRGELSWPVGVAIDTSDMVYVTDINNHHVCVFTSEGQFVTSFGKHGEGPGEFTHPHGVAVDNSGVVYVCDSGSGRVKFF